MPRSRIDFLRRTQPEDLPEQMDQPCDREELRACLRDMVRVNRMLFGYRPTFHWLESMRLERIGRPVRILDVGCGDGDLLRRIEQWASRRGIPVQLTGLDVNPSCVAIARETTNGRGRMEWVEGDVFAYSPAAPPHLVVSSLVAHHLPDGELVRLIQWMEQNAAVGWFINDLSRAPVPYHLLGWFARALRLHPFVQHDGPVSIARAFQPDDWRNLCARAGLHEDDVAIRAWQPARLCVSRSKA
jgi:2-polyprenyl-3-methyl-5-hydroxy-6-metoxy-1,4-benzoquinol methylase